MNIVCIRLEKLVERYSTWCVLMWMNVTRYNKRHCCFDSARHNVNLIYKIAWRARSFFGCCHTVAPTLKSCNRLSNPNDDTGKTLEWPTTNTNVESRANFTCTPLFHWFCRCFCFASAGFSHTSLLFFWYRSSSPLLSIPVTTLLVRYRDRLLCWMPCTWTYFLIFSWYCRIFIQIHLVYTFCVINDCMYLSTWKP